MLTFSDYGALSLTQSNPTLKAPLVRLHAPSNWLDFGPLREEKQW